MDVTVVAIFKNIGILSNWSAFISQDTLTKLFQLGRDSTGSFMIYLKDIERAETVMSILREKLKSEGYEVMEHDPRPFFTKFEVTAGMAWTGQRLDPTIWSDEVTFLMWVLTAVQFFIGHPCAHHAHRHRRGVNEYHVDCHPRTHIGNWNIESDWYVSLGTDETIFNGGFSAWDLFLDFGRVGELGNGSILEPSGD